MWYCTSFIVFINNCINQLDFKWVIPFSDESMSKLAAWQQGKFTQFLNNYLSLAFAALNRSSL